MATPAKRRADSGIDSSVKLRKPSLVQESSPSAQETASPSSVQQSPSSSQRSPSLEKRTLETLRQAGLQILSDCKLGFKEFQDLHKTHGCPLRKGDYQDFCRSLVDHRSHQDHTCIWSAIHDFACSQSCHHRQCTMCVYMCVITFATATVPRCAAICLSSIACLISPDIAWDARLNLAHAVCFLFVLHSYFFLT